MLTAEWIAAPGASTDEIQRLVAAVPHPLPAEYLELLSNTNGGEGALAVQPGWFQLFDIRLVLELWSDPFQRREYPNYLFVGSNGGLESFVLALQGPRAGQVLAMDAIAGEESAFVVSASFKAFSAHIGRRAAVSGRDDG